MQIHGFAPNPASNSTRHFCSLFCDAKAKISLMVHRRCEELGDWDKVRYPSIAEKLPGDPGQAVTALRRRQ
jgi:hypothetical protein